MPFEFHNDYAIPTNWVQKFHFSKSLPISGCFFFLFSSSFSSLLIIHILKGDISFWLGFHFTDTYWCWALFLYILNTYLSSMKNCLLKHYTHFLNSVICLLLFWSWVVLISYIFWILVPYSNTKFAHTSSHSMSYLFFFSFFLLIVEKTSFFTW